MKSLSILRLKNKIDEVGKILLHADEELLSVEKTRIRETLLKILGMNPEEPKGSIRRNLVLSGLKGGKLAERLHKGREWIEGCITFWNPKFIQYRNGRNTNDKARDRLTERLRTLMKEMKSALSELSSDALGQDLPEIVDKVIGLETIVERDVQDQFLTTSALDPSIEEELSKLSDTGLRHGSDGYVLDLENSSEDFQDEEVSFKRKKHGQKRSRGATVHDTRRRQQHRASGKLLKR